jgi:hypothetical protein
MFRLTIGVFYEPQDLANAIAELQREGITTDELCLTGTPRAIETFGEGKNSSGKQIGKPAIVLPQLSGLELVATDGRLLQTLLDHAGMSGGATPTHGWLLPDLLGGVSEHLRSGAIALFVSASNLGLQRRASRILLRYTAHTLQTHEFSARRADSATPSKE